MRVVYIIYNERPVSGLVRTQVISLLKEIKKQSSGIDITLLAFWQPWVTVTYKIELNDICLELEAGGIKVLNCPWSIIPNRYFMYNVRLFPVLHSWGSFIFRKSLSKNLDIVHCRGYFPTFLAAENKQMFGYRLIFDMRSFWPKEHVSVGAWTEYEDIYRMWEKIEKYTLDKSDAAVGASSPMFDDIEHITQPGKGVLIPICVDTNEFCFDESARNPLRKELGWLNRRIIAYQGSLGLYNRNIYEVAEYFKFILTVCPNICFLILTANRSVNIDQIMGEQGISASHYEVKHPRRGELPKWLSAADAGIHTMSPGPDSHTRLGAKVVEYLSCGLPIIVNANVGAAAQLIETYGVGLVINLMKKNEAHVGLESLLARSESMRERCSKLARELFSVESCAKKYISLYNKLCS
jgi:glycosyltransferase involved in cell wall biosynthesis